MGRATFQVATLARVWELLSSMLREQHPETHQPMDHWADDEFIDFVLKVVRTETSGCDCLRNVGLD